MKKIIQRTRKFEKSFVKLNSKIKNLFLKKLSKFIDSEYDPSLKTHKLKGEMKNKYAFPITDDVRTVYTKKINKQTKIIIFTFIDIGTHNKVY